MYQYAKERQNAETIILFVLFIYFFGGRGRVYKGELSGRGLQNCTQNKKGKIPFLHLGTLAGGVAVADDDWEEEDSDVEEEDSDLT